MRAALLVTGFLLTMNTAHANDTVKTSPGKPLHPIQVNVVVGGPIKAGAQTDAVLHVRTARVAQSVEVELQPQLPTVLSETRFSRRGEALRGEIALPFHFQAASDEPQPVTVLVRVTDVGGDVLTREVTLPLGGESERHYKVPELKVNREKLEKAAPPADVIVPARATIRRD